MAIDPDELFIQLERMGEDGVRKLHAKGSHFSPRKAPLIDEWLRRKSQSKFERHESSKQTIQVVAAIAAIIAAIAATVGATASILQLLAG